MSELKLISLDIRNFKGIKHKKIDFKGEDKALVGTNEVGKTTVADAYRWLLFDINMNGDSQFGIKPLDEDNNEIHHLNTIVTGQFTLDGKDIELKKDYHEVWTRSRGSSKQQMTGHTTDYFVDDEPMKKSEYEDYIDNIISEEIFKLITDPLYFNEQLHWKDQKDIIFNLVDKPEPETVATEAEVYYLVDNMKDKSVQKYQKVLKSKMTKLNNKIEGIPERIDEVQRSLSTEGLSYDSNLEDLYKKLEKKKQERKKIQNKISKLEVSKGISIKEKLIKAKEKYQDKKEELNNKAQKLIEQLRSKKKELENEAYNLEKELDRLEEEIKRKKETFEEKEEKRQNLLDEYHEWEDKEFTDDQKVCPECGQELPEDKIEEHREKFNNKKANKLEKILSKGKTLKEELKELNNNIEKIIDEIESKQKKTEPLKEKVQLMNERIKKGIEFKKNVAKGDKEELIEIQAEIDTLKEDLEDETSSPEELQKAEEKLQEVDKEIGELDKKVANMENIDKAKARIQELQEEEEKYRQKYEQLEKELYDTEKYIRTEADMLENDVNELFDITEFKLFEKQVNGAIKETCEALKDGVPFSDMNTGSKYQVGMDIINVLSDHYNFNAPVFVDNRERIATLPNIHSQTIHLIMTPQRKQLEVLDLKEETADDIVDREAGKDTLF